MYLLRDGQKPAQQMEGNFLSNGNLNAKCFYATNLVFRSAVSSQESKIPWHYAIQSLEILRVSKGEERKMYKSDFWI